MSGKPAEPSKKAFVEAALTHRAARLALAKPFSRAHAKLLNASGGRLVSRWFGAPVLVLEVPGRSSGIPRRTPLIYVKDGDRFVVTAANAGAQLTPNWFLNLRHAGKAIVHAHGCSVAVVAEESCGRERERLWNTLTAAYPPLVAYTAYTERTFPVVTLTLVTCRRSRLTRVE